MRTFGLIPAAGKSQRMGRPKLLLPLGEQSVLEHVVSAVHAAGIPDLLVVVAPAADALAERAAATGAHVLRLTETTPDMRASCQYGLAWIEQQFQPGPDDSWLLLPADHPTVKPEVIQGILAAGRAHRDKTIIVPVHQGRRGHPTLLRWSHVAGIRQLSPEHGLNTYIREHTAETLEMLWHTDEILRDLDTPEDYQRLLRLLETA